MQDAYPTYVLSPKKVIEYLFAKTRKRCFRGNKLMPGEFRSLERSLIQVT
jgi:hypothetical protein